MEAIEQFIKTGIELAEAAMEAGDPDKAVMLLSAVESVSSFTEERISLIKAIAECESGDPENALIMIGLIRLNCEKV